MAVTSAVVVYLFESFQPSQYWNEISCSLLKVIEVKDFKNSFLSSNGLCEIIQIIKVLEHKISTNSFLNTDLVFLRASI